jgi:F420H(2)-dependent quinone reductase
MTPPRPLLLLGWAFHRALFRVTGGRVGTQRAAGNGLGTLFLTSAGRTSGAIRRNALFYIEDGQDLIVVASNAGGNVDPNWWRNLQATPDAEVEIATKRLPVRARAATADEAARLWPRLDAANPNFAIYRAKAGREIPVVLLEPR